MKVGLTSSVVMHAALIGFGLFTLSAPREMQVAVLGPGKSSGPFTISQVERAMTHALDRSWHQVLRTSSNGGQSQTFVWIRDGEMTEIISVVAQPTSGVVCKR